MHVLGHGFPLWKSPIQASVSEGGTYIEIVATHACELVALLPCEEDLPALYLVSRVEMRLSLLHCFTLLIKLSNNFSYFEALFSFRTSFRSRLSPINPYAVLIC